MIIATGIDIVRNERFTKAFDVSVDRLARIYHPSEVERYQQLIAQDKKDKAVQFLASRFAVKEAFFKALFDVKAKDKAFEVPPFAQVAKQVFVSKSEQNSPVITTDVLDLFFNTTGSIVECSVSLAHEQCCSVAMVIFHILNGG